jgi:chemotaxis protein CheC
MRDEMDILREVSTTAAAHGSTALFKMLGKKIKLKLSTINSFELDQPPKSKSEHIVISAQCKILTGLEGKVVLTFDEKSAFRLISLCYQKKGSLELSGLLTEMGMSVLKEVSNVVIASYASALSMFLQSVVITTPPVLLSGPMSDLLMSTIVSKNKGYMLIIDTSFEDMEEKINGRMELVLTKSGMEMIQNACKKMLEQLEK